MAKIILSKHYGEKNLFICQNDVHSVRLSVATMKAIIAWAESQ